MAVVCALLAAVFKGNPIRQNKSALPWLGTMRPDDKQAGANEKKPVS
jgi:hypothetical protein